MSVVLITAIGSFSGDNSINSLKNAGCYVIGCDLNEPEYLAAGSDVHQFHKVPSTSERQEYVNALLEICVPNKVEYLIVLTDPEIDILCEFIELFETQYGITICLSPREVLLLCRNKEDLYEYFKYDSAVQTIPLIDLADVGTENYPIVIKPKTGRSSEGLIKAHSEYDFNIGNPRLRDCVIQPFLDGPIITVDCVRDIESNSVICIARKEVIRTKNGAGVSVDVFEDKSLNKVCAHICSSLGAIGAIGAICIEFIYHSGQYYLLEINPRFSAGISFSSAAGYDIPYNHLKCFQNQRIDKQIDVKNMTVVKQYRDIITAS